MSLFLNEMASQKGSPRDRGEGQLAVSVCPYTSHLVTLVPMRTFFPAGWNQGI